MEVVGGLASIIGIVEAISTTYKVIQHLRGLPGAFKEVNERLPLVHETLEKVQKQLNDQSLDKSDASPIKPILNTCKEKAESLKKIFEEVETKFQDASHGSAFDYYRATVLRLGKSHRVETLMQDLMKSLGALAASRVFEAATQSQVSRLEQAIEELSNMEPSVPDAEFEGSRTMEVTQTIAEGGHGHQAINQGQRQENTFGDQYNSNGDMYFVSPHPHPHPSETLDQEARELLIKILWDPDWRPSDDPSAKHSLEDINEFGPAIVQSLRFKHAQDREEAVAQAHYETFAWVFEEEPGQRTPKHRWPSFREWLEGNETGPYWIAGKPGSGKSTLMKFILQHPQLKERLRRWSGQLPLLVTRYYAWNAGSDLQKSRLGLLRTLLSQALNLEPALAPRVAPRRWEFLFRARKAQKQPEWHPWELEESLRNLLALCGRNITLAVFIDGLDEFDVPPIHIKSQILGPLRAIYSTPGTKVCLASREWNEFRDEFDQHPMLRMQHLTCLDIRHYVTAELANTRGFSELRSISPGEAEGLIDDLLKRANGVFLWITLVVKRLGYAVTEGRNLRCLRAIVNDLPSDISQLYSTIWKSVGEKNMSKSSQFLAIVCASREPLEAVTLWLIDENCSLDYDMKGKLAQEMKSPSIERTMKRCLNTYTRGILELSSSGIVDFLHRTAQDWAQSPEVKEMICDAAPDDFDPNLMLLRGNIIRLIISHSMTEPLLQAVMPYAFLVKDSPLLSPRLISTLDEFDETMQRAQGDSNWAKRAWRNGDKVTFFEVASRFCVLPYIRHKLSLNGRLLSPTSEYSPSALESAIHVGGADFRITEDTIEGIPIEGRLRTIELLVKKGASPNRVCVVNSIISGPIGGFSPSSILSCVQFSNRWYEEAGHEKNHLYYAAVEDLLTKKRVFWRQLAYKLGV